MLERLNLATRWLKVPEGIRSRLEMTWSVFRMAILEWSRHNTSLMGAALAYYAVFSLGPLLLIVTAIAGLVYGDEAVRGELVGEFKGALGETGARAVEAVVAGASSVESGQIAAVVGIALLIFVALYVVTALKTALNTIWNVDASQEAAGWWYLRTYSTSFAGIIVLGVLVTVSLFVSAALTALAEDLFGASQGRVVQIADFAASLVVLTIFFAALFKWFPDTHVAWQDVWLGAAFTALLFNFGKMAISWYIATRSFESTYGAAASVLVLLLWAYYAAQIVLFGAEVTHAYAHERGSRRRENGERTSKHCTDVPGAA